MKSVNEIKETNRLEAILGVYRNWSISGKNVLDVGCGNGVVSEALAKNLSFKITGSDIEQYLTKKIPFVLMADEKTLPFKSKAFDIVMFNDILHHTAFANQEALLKEALRVAKKRVLIFELKGTFFAYFMDFIINKLSHPQMNVPFTYRSKSAWLKLFKQLPVKITYLELKNKFSPVSRFAFCLDINRK